MDVNKTNDESDKFTFTNTGEHTPVMYPRSEADRAQSNNNKGGASVDAGPGQVNYEVGPYLEVVDDGSEGVDEGDGASR